MARNQARRTPSMLLLLGAGLGAAMIGRAALRRSQEADISGQVALVTGATSGLGFLMARELVRQGCKVAICARDEDDLRLGREVLTSSGGEVLAITCDVSRPDQVERMVGEATNHFGRIDTLINNAGVIQMGPLEALSAHDFEEAMDIMFWGTFHSTFAVLPQMRERQSGRIVNITSIGGKVSVPHLLPYNTAKHAAVGFSEGLHAELKRDGIHVTTIVPGLMRTGSYFNAEFKGQHEKEYTLFSLGSSLPLITMDAERAAKQVIQAMKRGEAERILSVPAVILAKLHGLFPSTMNQILGLSDRWFMPSADGSSGEMRPGRDIQKELDSTAQEAATTLGRESAERFQPPENVPDDTQGDQPN